MVSQLKTGGKSNNNPLNRESGSLLSPLGASHTFQSMFSLRANRTMRVQRYGQWIGKWKHTFDFVVINFVIISIIYFTLAYHDPGSHSVFWYNHEQSKGQWETPDAVRQWKETSTGQDSFDKVMKMKRIVQFNEFTKSIYLLIRV
jgi:hypothetical protein